MSAAGGQAAPSVGPGAAAWGQTASLRGLRGGMVMQRPLSPSEKVLWQVGAHAGNNIVVHAVFARADAALLQERLARLGSAFPLLAAHVTWQTGTLCFVAEPQARLPVRGQAQRLPVDARLEIEHELNQSFAPLHPLSRAVVLQEGTDVHVLLTCHHAVADGQSLVTLLRHVLQPPSPKACGLAASLESLLPASHRGWSMQRRVAGLLPGQLLERLRGSRCWPEAPAATTARSVVWLEDCAAEEIRALKARSVREKASLQGALCASLLAGAATVLGPEVGRLGCLATVDLRPYLPISAQSVGFYSGGFTTYHTVDPSASLWDLARDYTRTWRRATARRKALTSSWFYRLLAVSSDAREVTARCNSAQRAAVTVSNLGVVELGPLPQNWTLRSLRFFAATQGWPARSLGVVLSTTEQGCALSYVAAHPHPVAMYAGEVAQAAQALRRAALV